MGLKQILMHYTWDLAYGVYSEEILHEGLKNTKLNNVKNPYPNKWFADPFILEEDSTSIQFLVEEFDYSVGRGRIARLLVDKGNNEIKECSVILDLPTHLSFPVIYRKDDEIYVHPENSASGASYMYRYDRKMDKLVEPRLIIKQPIADAIIRQVDNCYIMYATRNPNANGCELIEYRSSSLFGPYTEYPPLHFELNTARMAGMFIGGIRPAQDCYRDYGKAVVLYNDKSVQCRIEPTNWRYAGIHTFNTLNQTFVIDIKKYDYPLLYKIIRKIRK